MNPAYPQMYNMPNMGMMNSNSMMNYTYLNSNYQNYHTQQPGYNAYMQNNPPTNKFTANQFYSPQTQNQMYNNVFQNKIPNQIPINVAGTQASTIPMPTAPSINNNINPNPNNSAKASPSITTLSHTSLPTHKELSLSSNTSVFSAASHVKKPINLEAQSFIPKNLKKPSISSEKDLQVQTPKKEAVDLQRESVSETPEKEAKQFSSSDKKNKAQATPNYNSIIPDKQLPSPTLDLRQKTPISFIKQDEIKKEKTPIKETECKQSPDDFSLNKKDEELIFFNEEKPAPPANANIPAEAGKPKPKTLLGSILSQSQASNAEAKPAERTVFNPVPVAAPAKKKQNEVSKAFEEKAKVLKEQEKLKKEEKLREEIKQKQASAASTPKKDNKELEKKAQKKPSADENESEMKAYEKEKEERKAFEETKEIEEKEKSVLEPIKLEEKPAERKIKIERFYFKVFEDEKGETIKNRYAFEYLFSHRNRKICYETKLVEDLMTGHFRDLKETVEEISSNRQQNRGNVNDSKGSSFGKRGTKFRDEPIQPKISNENTTFQRSNKIEFKQPELKDSPSTETGEGLGKWGRKDLSKEEKLASDFKTKREEQFKKDPIRFTLTE